MSPRLALLLPVLAFSCVLARKSTSYYGVQAQGGGVVYVLDTSGSMEGKTEGNPAKAAANVAVEKGADVVGDAIGGPLGGMLSDKIGEQATKLAGAKRHLIPAIRGLSDGTPFTIVAFGEQIETWKPELTTADDESRKEAIDYLRGLDAVGGTPARGALEKAFSFSSAKTIFFVSDGHPTDAATGQILTDVTAWNQSRGVTVNAIGLGEDQDHTFMEALAKGQGGAYVER